MNIAAEPVYLNTRQDGGVFEIILENGKAHALSRAMIRALQAALDQAAQDDSVKVVLIHGPGTIFCAGHDMKEVARHRADPDQGLAYLTDVVAACAQMMMRLAQHPKPTIGIVEGIATAGGLQLMASCDLAFAGDQARFSLPGVTNGGFCTTPSVAVARKIAPTHLADMSYSGDVFDASWAEKTGLVARVLPAGELLQFARGYAQTLAGRHAPAVQSGKAALGVQTALPLGEAYAAATPVMLSHFMDPHRITRDLVEWS